MCCTANSLCYCHTWRFKPNDLIIKLLHVYNQYPIPTLTNYTRFYIIPFKFSKWFSFVSSHHTCELQVQYLKSLSQLAGHDKLCFKSCELPEKTARGDITSRTRHWGMYMIKLLKVKVNMNTISRFSAKLHWNRIFLLVQERAAGNSTWDPPAMGMTQVRRFPITVSKVVDRPSTWMV